MAAVAGRADAEALKSEAARLREENERLERQNRRLEREIQQMKIAAAEGYVELVEKQKVEIGFIHFFGEFLSEPMQHAQLRAMADQVHRREGKAVTFLMDQRGYCVATSSEDAQRKGIAANELLKVATDVAGGSGGGRPNMAQGRIQDPSRFSEVKQRLVLYITERTE